MRARALRALRHPIAQNAISLSTIQVAITLVPLVVLPYLARVLGPSEFGVVVFVQSFSFLLGLVVEYGFGLSASRRVARTRDDPNALKDVVAGVLGAKLVLMSAAVLAALVAWPLVAAFRDRPSLLLFGVGLTFFQGLHPVWYFVGVERLRAVALLDLALRTLSAVAIVLLVKDRGDGELVLSVYLAAAALTTSILIARMYRQVAFRRPTREATRTALHEGAALFVSTAAVTLYTSANVFLIGILMPSAQVAFFSAAERLVRAAARILGQIGGATYPRVNYLLQHGREARANRLAITTLVVLGGAALAGALGLMALAPMITRIVYGPDFGAAVPVLRILALILPLSAVAATLGTQWLLPRNLDRQASRGVIVVGLFNVALVLLVTRPLGIEGAAWVLPISETLGIAINILIIRRAGIAFRGGRDRVADNAHGIGVS